MTLQKLLETFDPFDVRPSSSKPSVIDPDELEALRKQSFEAGYASGWDDAKAADAEARKRVDAELERNIQGLAFTYSEAVDRVRSELETFVSSLITSFIPDLTPELLREHVRTELIRLADEFVEVPLEIVAAPDCAELLGDMLRSDFSMEVELVTDPHLAPQQVFVRSRTREIEVDLAPLLGALREQFKAIQQNEEIANQREAER